MNIDSHSRYSTILVVCIWQKKISPSRLLSQLGVLLWLCDSFCSKTPINAIAVGLGLKHLWVQCGKKYIPKINDCLSCFWYEMRVCIFMSMELHRLFYFDSCLCASFCLSFFLSFFLSLSIYLISILLFFSKNVFLSYTLFIFCFIFLSPIIHTILYFFSFEILKMDEIDSMLFHYVNVTTMFFRSWKKFWPSSFNLEF